MLLELEVDQLEMVEMVLMFHPILQVVMEQRGLWVQQDIFQVEVEVVDLLQYQLLLMVLEVLVVEVLQILELLEELILVVVVLGVDILQKLEQQVVQV